MVSVDKAQRGSDSSSSDGESVRAEFESLGPRYAPVPLVQPLGSLPAGLRKLIDPESKFQDTDSVQMASPLRTKFVRDESGKLGLDLEPGKHVLDISQTPGLVFDNDGLLVNSERAILQCIFFASEKIVGSATGKSDFQWSQDQVARIKNTCFGKSEADMAASLLNEVKNFGLADGNWLAKASNKEFFEALIIERVALYEQKLASGAVEIMPGTIELLKAAHAAGAKIGFCTGNSKPFIDAQFEILLKPALPEIDTIIPPEHRLYGNNFPPGFGKPNSLPASIAAEMLGIDPWQCVFFEDRSSGSMSAIAAGYRQVVVVAENLDTGPFVDPSSPKSFPGYERMLEDFLPITNRLLSPDRCVMLCGLDAIEIINSKA